MVQVQADSFRTPVENASVKWPEHLCPCIPVARLRQAVNQVEYVEPAGAEQFPA